MKNEENKKLSGTFRMDRENVTSRKRTGNAKKKPTFPQMDKDEKPPREVKKLYNQLCDFLMERDSLDSIDSINAAGFAYAAYFFLVYAEKALKNPMQQYESGATNISTEFVIYQKAENALEKYSKMFGLSVRDREKIMSYADDGGEDDSPITRLLMQIKRD